MKKAGFRLLFALLLLASCWSQALPVHAEDLSARLIRAAVLSNSFYAYQDSKGVWHGMDVDCLTNISQREGFRIEFVDSSNDPNFMENLDSGVYDIVCNVVKTPEREADYLFNEVMLGSVNNMLYVRGDDNRWEYGNIEQVSKMRIGVLASYTNNADFRTWCTNHSVTPMMIEYSSIDEMNHALSSGEIDGDVNASSYTNDVSRTFQTIMEFLPESYYYAMRKSDTELKNAVDTAMVQIIAEDPYYLESLRSKYGAQFQLPATLFTQSEQAYIAAHPTLTVALLRKDAPYCSESGTEYSGILPDYYAMIAKAAGMELRFVTFDTSKEAEDAVISGSVDVLGVFSSDIVSASQSGLTLTNSYYSADTAMLTFAGRDSSSVKKIAVVSRSLDAIQSNFSIVSKDAEILSFESLSDCFDALNSEKADALICALPSATWLLNSSNASAYSITSLDNLKLDFCGAVAFSNRTLRSILDKCIAGTKSSFPSIITNDTLQESSWQTFITRIPPAVIAVSAAVMVLIVAALAWALVTSSRNQKIRTAALAAQSAADAQRLQAEAMKRTAEDKNSFFASISHDMRTPLNAIIGFSAMAEKEADPEKKNAYLDKISTSGKLLNDLVNDTLTLSKASSGKLTLHEEPVRIRALFQDIEIPIREAAEKKKISFSFSCSDLESRAVMADRLNIEKICLNLLTNAIKYTPEGGHVSFRAADCPGEGGADTLLSVRDDGIGMSDEFQKRMYEPFVQENRDTHSTGTGLGLSIVHDLVALMHGTIRVTSHINQGTDFEIQLHFRPAEDEALAEEPADQEEIQARLAGKSILVCEDNELNRELIMELLHQQQITAISAENGQKGVQRFTESRPGGIDAVLMDIRMPVMDGLEAARAIRALDRADAGSVPIIALTANAFDEDIEACRAAGMNAHVTKPIDSALLFRTIAEALPEKS